MEADSNLSFGIYKNRIQTRLDATSASGGEISLQSPNRAGEGVGKNILSALQSITVSRIFFLPTQFVITNLMKPLFQMHYHQQDSSSSPITNAKQPNPMANSFYKDIVSLLEKRAHHVNQLLRQASHPEGFLDAGGKKNIISHCNQYSPISGLIPKIINNQGKETIGTNQKFWSENQRLQRLLQEELRSLKVVDSAIDNIVNEEFDKCNEIDEIQQTIRIILSKKDREHIKKAEPYYVQKQQKMDVLSSKKKQKERAKAEKLALIRNILGSLLNLKKHRQAGLSAALIQNKESQRQNHALEAQLIEQAVGDIREVNRSLNEIQSSRKELPQLEKRLKELTHYVGDLEHKISIKTKEIVGLLEEQNEATIELDSISRLKAETAMFQKTFFSLVGLSDIPLKSPHEYQASLDILCEKLSAYGEVSYERQKQVGKIKQGIQTTERTIGIFQHILEKIESETIRRNELLSQIEKIQQWHTSQDEARQKLAQSETYLEQLTLKKSRLTKSLEDKIDEADVSAYKSIHSELEGLEQKIDLEKQKVQKMRQHIGEMGKTIFSWTVGIQEDYSDILSEVVPSVWFRDNDFSRQQTIKDLNLYLQKTFKRLSIAD